MMKSNSSSVRRCCWEQKILLFIVGIVTLGFYIVYADNKYLKFTRTIILRKLKSHVEQRDDMYHRLPPIRYVFSISHNNITSSNDITLLPPKVILTYTRWFGDTIWFGFKDKNYTISKCKVNNCVFTTDHAYFQRSDAVLFHARDMTSLTELKSLKQLSLNQTQKWVWQVLESPVHVSSNLADYNNLFDWTATYRRDSEVYMPYYLVEPIQQSLKPTLDNFTNYASGKNKLIVAAISHCVNARIDMVKKISKYVQLDLYGGCKYQKDLPSCIRNTAQCKELKRSYKFYFAMENSHCTDYITEKFYKNGLIEGLVPIVVAKSGENGPQYAAVAPPKSFINILDFPNLEAFAEHVKYLDSNDTAYNEYHKWRSSYKIVHGFGMCDVCNKLWNPPKTQTGIQIGNFFNAKQKCQNWEKVLEGF